MAGVCNTIYMQSIQNTVKSCSYESRYNAKSRYYSKLFNNSVMELSIEMSHYKDKSRNYQISLYS